MIISAPPATGRPARRIVSLVPSQTELLSDLGLDKETVGITKFCIHPPAWFRNKIRVGGTKNIDIQRVISLNPDLVIANREENVKNQVEALGQLFPVLVTDVNTLGDATAMIRDIGARTNRQREAHEMVTRINALFITLPELPSASVCYLIWKEPYMVAASCTFINSMIARAGFRNVFSDRERYPVVALEDIRVLKPDIILLSSEPYPFKEKHLAELRQQLPGITPILVDGEMFSWYGSRLLQAPAYLTRLNTEVMRLLAGRLTE